MLPQRTTPLGWTMLPACLYLAWKGPVKVSPTPPQATLAGLLPMMHTHTFLAWASYAAAGSGLLSGSG